MLPGLLSVLISCASVLLGTSIVKFGYVPPTVTFPFPPSAIATVWSGAVLVTAKSSPTWFTLIPVPADTV